MAQWIWFPGDFETMLLNRSNWRRFERDIRVCPIWQMHAAHPAVRFLKTFDATKAGKLKVFYDGESITPRISGTEGYIYGFDGTIDVKPGRYELDITVFTQDGRLPSLYLEGEETESGEDWQVTCGDGNFYPAAAGGFEDPNSPPGNFSLPIKPVEFLSKHSFGGGICCDAGRELVGFLELSGCRGNGEVFVYYGESETEAEDFEHCEVTDRISVCGTTAKTQFSKGFRYATLVCGEGTSFETVKILEEFRPQERSAAFTCADPLLEKIWGTARYTLSLNTREFFIDGVKRDRWVWGGDAYQCFLMNWYSFF